MFKVSRFAAALLAVFALSSAASADVFTVTGVKVDATADSAAAAREVAVARGQTEAAQRLFERLTLPEDRIGVAGISAATASQLLAGFEVDEEKASATRYIASLTFAFDPGQVRAYLRSSGTPFVESQARPAVVAPVWRGESGATLWQGNPFLAAWQAIGAENAVAPIIAPVGDLGDVSTLSAAAAEGRDPAALAAFAARYGAEKVLVASAAPQGAGGQARLALVDAASGSSQDLGSAFGPDLEALARDAAEKVQLDWKRTAVVRETTVGEIDLTVLYADMNEWLRIQNGVAGASLVQQAQLVALADGGALMRVRHRGRPEQLAAELRERSVTLASGPLGWTAVAAGREALIGDR